MSIEAVLNVLGGLGLFLYGMFRMGDGLKNAAGDRLRSILEALTSNRIIGILVGVIVTCIIQSSSATTVMLVGFVNAGLMRLEQAMAVTLGANIGTTITAQMIAFRLERCALPAIGLGMFFSFFAKKKSHKGLVDFLLGFGILFLGISIMGEELVVLRTYPPFINLMINSAKNPILGVLVGVVVTAIIQSSSATTGLLVMLGTQGLISLEAAIPITFGANVGTTVTALLASIGTNLAARRTAFAHFLMKVFGTIAFLPFIGILRELAVQTSPVLSRQIANAHTIFNVALTLVLLPFVNRFAVIVERLIKGEEHIVERGPQYLDERFIATPFTAVAQTKKEVCRMARLSQENLTAALNDFLGKSKADRNRLQEIEEVIDELEEAVSYYVAKVSQQGLTERQSTILTSMINVATDVERIGDHAVSIIEMSDYRTEQNLPMSDEAIREIMDMGNKVSRILDVAITCLENDDTDTAKSVIGLDDGIDSLEKDLRIQHIKRLNQGICFPTAGVVYLELLTHLERIGDHSVNIAEAVIEYER